VTYAENIDSRTTQTPNGGADATLNRSYDYDQVGRLWVSHMGNEADAHAGLIAWPSQPSGSYSQQYGYDVWGNTTSRLGWGGANASYTATYTNNRRDGLQYDAAGNVTSDGGQAFTYDATGQQASASYSGYSLTQGYDGDRLRAQKTENGTVTYYLRSSVLGGQVVAEINSSGGWTRGYVYLGSQLLAVQSNDAVTWVHQDPVTKSQRATDINGNGVSSATVDVDPWGGETSRSAGAFQPHKFTSYERDGNASDEAMMRRYNRWWSRFDQPDPADSSYDLTNPQSLNRYAYTGGDPVNFVDPSGTAQVCIGGSVTVLTITTWDVSGAQARITNVRRQIIGVNPGVCYDFGFVPESGGGGAQNPPQQEKKPKCKQSPNGGDVSEILKYLSTYGLMNLIDQQTIRHSINLKTGGVGEGIQFQFYNRADAITTFSNSPHFANAHLGFEHNGQVGGDNMDFRGYQEPNKNASGAIKSLQVVIGPAGKVPGAPERALGYADLDCDNPVQNPLGHIFKR
jgi:RHS repeat-associated protein